MPAYGNTTNWALRKLLGSSNANDIDAGIGALADDVDALLTPTGAGALASRPTSTVGSPGKSGRTYLATDTHQLFRDNGTGWDEIPLANSQQAWQALALTGGATLHYYKDTMGFVHLRNEPWVFSSTVPVNTALGTLPAGYRPGAVGVNAVVWTIPAAGSFSLPSAQGSFSVTAAGVVTWSSGNSLASNVTYFPGAEGWRAEN